MEKPPTDFDLELDFIRNSPELFGKVDRYCSQLIRGWHEQYQDLLQYKKKSLQQTLDEGKRYTELVRLKKEANAERMKLRNAQHKAEVIERYRKMKFSDLVRNYLEYYMRVRICHTSIIPDIETELLNIIEQEVKEFRSQAEQEELNNKVNQLKEAKCTADFRALGI
jgi:hypothetical protein